MYFLGSVVFQQQSQDYRWIYEIIIIFLHTFLVDCTYHKLNIRLIISAHNHLDNLPS